ncbi:aado/keto reductase [Peniophora sp. CONT]|nr:aado/keto reductase [Peniophora sp. CONT]
MLKVPNVILNTGAKLPLVGLGVWMGELNSSERAYEMCRKAIAIGYRHIDTAAIYKLSQLIDVRNTGSEGSVGKAIRDSGISREEFFVTTKLAGSYHDKVSEALNESLSNLGLDYVDLYLIHLPQASRDGKTLQPDEFPTINDTWASMEKVYEEGKAKAIGVSDFSVKLLERLARTQKVVPTVNQVEMHPFLPQNELKAYCDAKGIHLTAYSPFGQPIEGQPWRAGDKPVEVPSLLRNDLITRLAEKYQTTTGQILLSWSVQRGTSVVPKSEKEERLRNNFTVVELEDDDVKAIDELHHQPGLHRSLLTYLHSEKGVQGWTYEQLGWSFDSNGIVV